MNKNVNIAVVGLGQVGIYLFNELNIKKNDIETKTGKKIIIKAVSAKNINKKRRFKINKKIFYRNPLNIFKKNKIDVLFEMIGLSDGISKKVVETALKKKIHVITPNKALIAKHGDYLSHLAEKNKVNLEFEASVAGGIPVLRTIKEGLATNRIEKFYGILNGRPVGETVLQGEGAGPGPTSSSLLSDLLSILRGNIKRPFGVSGNKRKNVKIHNHKNYINSLYLRFEVNDKPGVLSAITNSLAKYNISVKRIVQTPDKKNKKATIVIITHNCKESSSNKCLSFLKKNKNIIKKPIYIRVINLNGN